MNGSSRRSLPSRTGRHPRAGAAAASLLLACCGSLAGFAIRTPASLAQTALGDGHALDANNSATGNRYNTQVRDIGAQIRFNNAIITGQALGGKSFRGNAGYAPSSDFRSTTAADSLYTFERDSALSRLAGTGVRGTDALRYQFALSTGSVVPPAFAGTSGAYARAPVSTGSAITNRVPSSPGASVLRSTSQFLTQRSISPTVVGYRTDDNGGSYSMAASPLLGVNVYKLEQRDVKKQVTPGAAPEQPRENSATDRDKKLPVVNPYTGLESSAAGLPSTIDQFGTGRAARMDTAIPTTLVQPISMLHEQVLDRSRGTYDAAVKRSARSGAPGGAGGGSPEGNASAQGAPGSGLSWEEQLVRMRAALRGESPEQAIIAFHKEQFEAAKAAKKAASAAPTTSPDDQPAGTVPVTTPGLDASKSGAAGSPLPTDAEFVEREKLEADRVKRELAAMQSTGRKLSLSPAMLEALKAGGVVFEKLDAGLNPQAKTGEPDAIYAEHMAAGQAFLAQRKYFEAEERFTRAIAATPGDPMAAIGRMHAQLGAGLFVSTAMNLRRVLLDHPEFVNARFAPALLPSPERLDEIRARLLDELVKAGPESSLGKDAGLVLAYVGHATGDRPTVIRGLREFAKRVPQDAEQDQALGELLARVWLSDEAGAGAGSPAAPTPSMAPPSTDTPSSEPGSAPAPAPEPVPDK